MRILLARPLSDDSSIIPLPVNSQTDLVRHEPRGQEVLALVQSEEFDVIVVASRLSDMDGFELIRRLRARGVAAPLLLVCSGAVQDPFLRGFGAGADDVITHRLDAAELQARLRALVRRSRGVASPSIAIGCIEINLHSREVRAHGRPVSLTSKEYAVLELLALRRNTVLTKDVFLDHLYGGMNEPADKIIDVFVCKLRKKLAQVGAELAIATVRGIGYMMRDTVAGPANGSMLALHAA